jgi:DNA topoisomerase I
VPFAAVVTQLLEAVGRGDVAVDELIDPVASADAAGLRYVSDEAPGIRRKKAGSALVYTRPDGSRVTDERTLARIKSLAIPPAWTDVWICPNPSGHIQATGRDAKGRKQYRYHPRWREVRDAVKYDKMIAFAEALPRMRERVEQDLALRGAPREKVLATVVRLLEHTRIRVGNEEYKKQNKSFGLTTLQDRHVKVEGSTIHFRFKGKHGITHEVELRDRRLARVVQRCRDIPGQDLFQYIGDDGQRHDVTSGDVNDYIREISGGEFTAKDFRTWAGTLLAARFLRTCEPCADEKQGKKSVVRCIESVSQELGNTVAVCRKCYVHPVVVKTYLDGRLEPLRDVPNTAQASTTSHVLDVEEAALVEMLKAVDGAAPAPEQQAA